MSWLFTIYMGEQVVARFGQIMVSKNFPTGKFRPRIALTICTNRYLPTNGREGLKTGLKYSFQETEHEVPLLQEIFRRNDAKRRVAFTF